MKKRIITHLIIFAVIYLVAAVFRFDRGLISYVNLSDALIMILLTHSEPPYAAIIAGLSTALADITAGFGYYAPYTFIIKGISGYLTALGWRKHWKNEAVCIIVGILNVIGYSLRDYLIFEVHTERLLQSLAVNGIIMAVSVIAAIIANRYCATIKDRYLR